MVELTSKLKYTLIMNYLKISAGIFLALAASRFVPHPPNFTSLLALSFAITDLFIGFHAITLFTWGSVLFIGFLSKHFIKNTISRISGALVGACIFFVVTNFGVWVIGSYGYTLNGLLICYTLAIPFFAYSLISTVVFSSIIETIYKFQNKKLKI
jgi:hypothetical protein